MLRPYSLCDRHPPARRSVDWKQFSHGLTEVFLTTGLAWECPLDIVMCEEAREGFPRLVMNGLK